MLRIEVYDDSGACIEWKDLEGDDFVRVVNGQEVERRPATPEELAPYQPPEAVIDLVTLANNLAALTEAVDVLILDALEGGVI